MRHWDFSGGSAVKNMPSNAGDMSSIPARGTKIPHATRQLSLHATTKEACVPQQNPAQPTNKYIYIIINDILKIKMKWNIEAPA